MPAKRKYDRDVLVPMICERLAQGSVPLTVILANMTPPIPSDTVDRWRREDAAIANAIDRAFLIGGDRMAVRMRMTAQGKTPEQGGDSTGSVERDKLVLWLDEKLLAKWDARYRQTVAHANDPTHPLTDAKPTQLTEEQLLQIAQRGVPDDGSKHG